MDGLKPFPIDHGPWNEGEDWTEKFRSVMSERLAITAGEQYHDIRFNLMTVVPDRRLAITHKLKMLKTNKQIVLDALQQLMKIKHSEMKANRDEQDKVKKESFEVSTEEIKVEETENNAVATSTDSKVEEVPKNELNITKMKDKVMLCPLDYSTPLTIQTSPAPSTSSTDTSSEIGSAFNSPTQAWNWVAGQNSPTSKDFKRFVVIKVANEDKEVIKSGKLDYFKLSFQYFMW